jgi:DNA replication protein DnaC
MLWTDQIQRIKAGINDQETLDELLEPLKHVTVLYVDDLFKGAPKRDGILTPTDSDKRLAFELFNHRYVAGLRTIISCEWDIRELIDVGQGTFSRVYERCKPYMVHVAPDKAKNWRLR